MLRLVFICFFVVLKTSFAFPQSLQFYEEALFFEINDGHFIVDGQYWFKNTGNRDIHQILFYPFPQDDNIGMVDSVIISDVTGFEEDLIIGGFKMVKKTDDEDYVFIISGKTKSGDSQRKRIEVSKIKYHKYEVGDFIKL